MRKGLWIAAAALMSVVPMVAEPPVNAAFVGRAYDGWYAPYWGFGPGYWGPYYVQPDTGEVKLETKVKTADVFINGSYAGTTKHNREMYLRPGAYTIEIREAGRTRFAEKVYVVAGKTLKLRPEL
jgi:PEGA domain